MVDLGLTEGTTKIHLRYIKRYLEFCKKANLSIEESSSMREFLSPIRDKNQNTYGNHVKALRVFYREYLKSNVAESFKIPQPNQGYVKVPTRAELKVFYEALPSWREKALFLMWASSGRRRDELLYLNIEDVDFELRQLAPIDKESQTKNTWFSYFNIEALEAYQHYQREEGDKLDGKLFKSASHINQLFKDTSERTGVKISPQVLREWFCQEMGRLKVPDRFVDAFCGRVPKSVLGKRYTDYSPEELKRIYDEAGLKVLE